MALCWGAVVSHYVTHPTLLLHLLLIVGAKYDTEIVCIVYM